VSKHLTSGTYLHNPRYLELNAKCRLSLVLPTAEPHQFATKKEDILGLGLLTEAEYEEMCQIAKEWWDREIQRLKDMGFHAQVEQLERYGYGGDE